MDYWYDRYGVTGGTRALSTELWQMKERQGYLMHHFFPHMLMWKLNLLIKWYSSRRGHIRYIRKSDMEIICRKAVRRNYMGRNTSNLPRFPVKADASIFKSQRTWDIQIYLKSSLPDFKLACSSVPFSLSGAARCCLVCLLDLVFIAVQLIVYDGLNFLFWFKMHLLSFGLLIKFSWENKTKNWLVI